jgi:hypothetical protein
VSNSTTPLGITFSGSDETRLKHYLLDQLGVDERAGLERAYFEDDEKFGALLAVEDDLVNGYVRSQLPEGERLLFERTILATAAGRERVRMARALGGAVARLDADGRDAPARRATGSLRSWFSTGGIGFRWAAAAAALLVVSAGGWSLFEIARLRDRINGLDTARETLQRDAEAARGQAAREQARADGYQEDLQRLRSATPSRNGTRGTSPTVALSLVPVALRSAGESDQLVLGPETKVVELELAVDFRQGLESFRVALEEAGRPIGRVEISKGPAQAPGVLLVPIPAYMLTPGASYTARLERLAGPGAPETIHRYEFRVVARP